jgi:hypothetical protein
MKDLRRPDFCCAAKPGVYCPRDRHCGASAMAALQ